MGLETLKKLFSRKEYIYHGTTTDKIPSILSNGLDPKFFKRKIISFTDLPGFAAFWKDLDVVIIVDREKLNQSLLKRGWYKNEWTYSEVVLPKDLIIKKVIYDKINKRISFEDLDLSKIIY